MKHILILNSKDSMTHGGAEEIIRLVTMFFINRGYEVHMFFLLEKRFGHWEKITNPNLHLYYSSGGGKLGIFSVLKNFWSVRDIKFDYSFSSIAMNNGIIGVLKRLGLIHVNHVIGRESTLIFKRFKGYKLWLKKIMYLLGYPSVGTVICQTEFMREELLEQLPWLAKRSHVVVIPNPVDIEMMDKRSGEEIAEIRSHKPYIVACGRLHPVKAYNLLIEAFARIQKEQPELHLLILGEGNEREKLTSLAEGYGVSDKVYMPGEVPNVYPYFKNAVLCTVTSHIEGFPNVLLQMMSQNDRVVSTTCAGGIDKIKGLITCRPSDVDALTDAIRQGLKADVSETRALFDAELQSRSIEKFIQSAINSTK